MFDAAMTAQLEVQPSGDLRSFRVSGELDLATVGALVERLHPVAAGADGDLRLEVGGLTFIDSTGLHALMRLARAMPAPHRLVLVDVTAPVRRLLELTGLRDAPEIVVEPDGAV